MSDTIQIQLGSAKNVDAINVDQNINIEFKSAPKEILSYNESSVIDVASLFDTERQESEVYRVYGRIDFMSIINGLKREYGEIKDFFTPPRLGDELTQITKNLLTSFDIYLCYPSTGNTIITGNPYGNFIRDYVVISKLQNIEVYKAGFSRNIFFNYIYAFDFNVDFNIEGLIDSFGKPINRFYLYFNFKADENIHGANETISVKTYLANPYFTRPLKTTYTTGDLITGDLVNYVNSNFEEDLVEKMEYYPRYQYLDGMTNKHLQFKYFPFVEVKVRDFNDEISSGNITGGTEIDLNIPSYAISVDNKGNYIWKDILANGYIDSISGAGVDYPFINKRHYIFNTIVLGLKPDMNDANTNTVFSTIKFGNNNTLYNKPSSDVNALGNKCA